MSEVVTLGESMVAFVPETAGPLRHADRFSRTVAGAESNVAIGLSRLGHATTWISLLGDDAFGRYIWATLRGEGVDLRHARLDPRAPTGVMFKERLPAGESRVSYYRHGSAAALLDAGDVPNMAFVGAKWLHLTGITPALGPGPERAVRRAIGLARAAGTAISFDPNYRARLWSPERARPVLLDLARGVDLLVLGESEGQLMFSTSSAAATLRAALDLGCRLVALKRAERGALLMAAGATSPDSVPAYPVALVEPTGAGDAFAAGLLSGLLEGRSHQDAARLAALCGALACTVVGDWEGAPERYLAERCLSGMPDRPR